MKRGMSLIADILIRYSSLILLGFASPIIYLLLTPLTIYPLYFLFKIFFSNVSLLKNLIMVNGNSIEIINPCIAGSAYYLLLILNLATSGIKLITRIKLLVFSFLSFLLVNLLRIIALSALFMQGFSFFDLAHKIFWYAGSTIIVVGIWFIGVKIFNVKEIPFYSDIKLLLKLGKKSKKSKSSKKHK